MLKPPSPKQHALEMVTLEELVPADHLLRKIAQHIDFEFIRPATQHLYCADNGRPAIDPVTLFKMLFIGYLFGVRSERQLMREIQVNVAYRWFLDLSLTDKVPDASTLSQNRRRRFVDTDIEQVIFDGIVGKLRKIRSRRGPIPRVSIVGVVAILSPNRLSVLHKNAGFLSHILIKSIHPIWLFTL